MAARREQITELGWEIRKRLAEQKLTQTEFCQQHDIPKQQLSMIISGKRKDGMYFRKVIEALEIEPVSEKVS